MTYDIFLPEIMRLPEFFLVQQLFIYYSPPDVPVNTVASYHRLGGEGSVHDE